MRLPCFFSAAALLLVAASAQANVVYNWHSESSGPHATATGGEIIVTNRAYRAGSMSAHFGGGDYGDYGLTVGGVHIPTKLGGKLNDRVLNSPLLRAGMTVGPGDLTGGAYDGATIIPRQPAAVAGGKEFILDLTFNDNDTLSGSFRVYGHRTWFASEGEGYLWDVFDVNSDAYGGTGYCAGEVEMKFCSGGSGYWKLASKIADVPAPPVWGLFGLAAVAVFGFTRRRNT